MPQVDPTDSAPTPAQRLELAARRYCTRLGVDPDEPGNVPYGISSVRWQLVARDIEMQRNMLEAVAEAYAWSTRSPGGLNS